MIRSFQLEIDIFQVFTCISQIKSTVGPIDILVNNAGLMDYCKMINCELDIWVNMVNVNCIGLLNVTAAVLPHMKDIGSGHVVNITSDAGRKVSVNYRSIQGDSFMRSMIVKKKHYFDSEILENQTP